MFIFVSQSTNILRTLPESHFPAQNFDYNCSFEHSLVQELGYDGYARLRRGFDRAFGGQELVPKFPLVIDAGCGTGLVGEQVRVGWPYPHSDNEIY